MMFSHCARNFRSLFRYEMQSWWSNPSALMAAKKFLCIWSCSSNCCLWSAFILLYWLEKRMSVVIQPLISFGFMFNRLADSFNMIPDS